MNKRESELNALTTAKGKQRECASPSRRPRFPYVFLLLPLSPPLALVKQAYHRVSTCGDPAEVYRCTCVNVFVGFILSRAPAKTGRGVLCVLSLLRSVYG